MAASIENFSQNDKVGDISAALRRDRVAIVHELLAPDVMDQLIALPRAGSRSAEARQSPAKSLRP